jgi:CheY-like chemotaxis protein
MNSLTILVLTIIIAIIIGISIYVNIKFSKKKADKHKTIKIANDIKNKLSKNTDKKLLEKSVSASELINNKSGIKKANSTNGIINKPLAQTKTKKAVNWMETTSYEEDVKSVDIDSILKSVENTPLFMDEMFTPEDTVEKMQIVKPLVLLVDDSMVVRKYVGDLLKKNNYELIIKNDGVEALAYLRSAPQKPELIISDIEMPNMNGIELIETIRKEKRFNNVPILVISAHAASHLKLMESESIQGFIKKPFEDMDLISQTTYLINN